MYLRQLYYYNKIMKQQWMKEKELNNLQFRYFKSLVKHAYNTVPYYHNKFRKIGIKPKDIKSLKDIKNIPILYKEDVLNNYSDFISKDKQYEWMLSKKRFFSEVTSGSSGKQFTTIFDLRAYDYLSIIHLRALIAAGYRPHNKIAYYWYKPSEKKPHNFFGFMRTDYISCKLSLTEQIALLSNLKPEFINYFSSSIYSIARIIDNKELKKIQPKAIITHGEVLSKNMRKVIEDKFNCKVFDHYASNEFNKIAWECNKHSGYHINTDSLIVECLHNKEQVSSGELGNLVITALTNYFFPLIRYDIGDKGILSNEKCSCGRGLSLLKDIKGCSEDFVILPDKQLADPKEIIDILTTIEEIKRFNLIQKTRKKINVNVVLEKNFLDSVIEITKERLSNLFSNQLEIKVIPVDEIKKGARGKIKLVKSLVKK